MFKIPAQLKFFLAATLIGFACSASAAGVNACKSQAHNKCVTAITAADKIRATKSAKLIAENKRKIKPLKEAYLNAQKACTGNQKCLETAKQTYHAKLKPINAEFQEKYGKVLKTYLAQKDNFDQTLDHALFVCYHAACQSACESHCKGGKSGQPGEYYTQYNKSTTACNCYEGASDHIAHDGNGKIINHCYNKNLEGATPLPSQGFCTLG